MTKLKTEPVTTSPLHSKLPPSGAERWTVCMGSVDFLEVHAAEIPPQDTAFSKEGTVAHDLAAKILTGAHRLVHSDEPDMLEHVRGYVDFVTQVLKDPKDKVLIERRVPLFYMNTQHGTVDCALIGENRIVIVDLKYGAGLGVYAEYNKQLAIYAESLISGFETIEDFADDFPVGIHIYQPRDRNDDKPVRSWITTRGELRKFTKEIDAKAKAIQASPKGHALVAGPHCDKTFCPARGICPKYAAQGLEILSDEPVDVVVKKIETLIPEPSLLTREQRLKIIAASGQMRKWLDAIEEKEMADLMAGAEPVLFKIVEGKSNRKWPDVDAPILETAAQYVDLELDLIAPRTLLSPAQMEKALKKHPAKDDIMAHAVKPVGKPTLADIGDKRPALSFNPTEGLTDIDEGVI